MGFEEAGCGLLLFAMIRSVVKSFKVPDVEDIMEDGET